VSGEALDVVESDGGARHSVNRGSATTRVSRERTEPDLDGLLAELVASDAEILDHLR
jgi:hypothetical protein